MPLPGLPHLSRPGASRGTPSDWHQQGLQPVSRIHVHTRIGEIQFGGNMVRRSAAEQGLPIVNGPEDSAISMEKKKVGMCLFRHEKPQPPRHFYKYP